MSEATDLSPTPLGSPPLRTQPQMIFPILDMDLEEAKFAAEVAAVQEWWNEPRWAHTKRIYTADELCAKRGSLQINYASNAMSKKLWEILETRWKASILCALVVRKHLLTTTPEQRCQLHFWMHGPCTSHPDGQIPGHCLCIWMAMLLIGFI